MRPPWWPDGESWPPEHWPPQGREGWGRHRGRFMWRFGCLFGVILAMLVLTVTVAVWLIAVALGLAAVGHPVRLVAIAAILVGVAGAVWVGRAVRRFASPVGDLVEAAGRIEAGDYSARAPVRGPREVRSLARAFNAMSARLEETDRERRSFLADVSHELRTPLSVIRGQIEAIEEGVYPADDEHLAPVREATQVLEQLVEDLRTLALAESGSLTLVREPVDLALLANEVTAAFRAQADAASVALRVEAAPDVPSVAADPARLRGVLGNLLSNALRHTPPGGSVDVRVRPTTEGPSGGVPGGVEVEVADTGSGISPELLPRVFERFVRSPGSPGSGLGLAIARDIIAAHGGGIVAESDGRTGTTIRFRLPGGSPDVAS